MNTVVGNRPKSVGTVIFGLGKNVDSLIRSRMRSGNFNRLKYKNSVLTVAWTFLVLFAAIGCTATTSPGRLGWLTPPVKRSVWNPTENQSGVVLGQQGTPLPPSVAQPGIYPVPPSAYPAANQSSVSVPLGASPQQASAFPQPVQVASRQSSPPAPPELLPEPPSGIWNTLSQGGEAPPEATPLPRGAMWNTLDGKQPRGISIEEAKKQEEFALEKSRLMEIERTSRHDGLPEHLRPLPSWYGPFEDRNGFDEGTLDEAAIVQASHNEPTVKIIDPADLYDWEKDQEKPFDWESLDPAVFSKKIVEWAGYGPDEKKAVTAMEEGHAILMENRDLKDKEKCIAAAKKFETAAWRWPSSVLAEDALYLAGECYYFADRYPKAMKNYQKLVVDYHHSKHLDTAVRRLFRIARYWEAASFKFDPPLNMTNKEFPWNGYFTNAKKTYETIFLNDTNGPISDDAVMALATAYFRRGLRPGDAAFDQAAFYFSFLREHYPNSPHIIRARELELLALTNTFHGAGYNTKALERANRLAEQTLRHHTNELSAKEKQDILQLQEGILDKQAESSYEIARYWQSRREYGAARMMYNDLIRQYPQTTYAENARIQMDLIAGKPDTPRQFDWFYDWMDMSKKKRLRTNDPDAVAHE